jgi:ABC-type nitrate/sulfonate/bicarbonate transport system substrate-binding protein
MRLTVGSFGGVSALPMKAAIETGAFEQVGLDVRCTRTGSSAQLRAGLRSGTLFAAQLAPDNLVAWAAEDGPLIQAWLAGSNGPVELMSTRARGIGDLRGARIGVDAPDSGFVTLLGRLLANDGLSLEHVRLVPIGATRLRFEALLSAAIDGTMLTLPWSRLAERSGASALGDHRAVAPGLLTSCTATSRERLQHEASTASAYARALEAAMTWLRDPAHDRQAATMLAEDTGIDPGLALEVVSLMHDQDVGWPRSLRLTRDALDSTIEIRGGSTDGRQATLVATMGSTER